MREITVRQECSNRGDCRYGLHGVKVKVPGYQGEFFVRSSDWDRSKDGLMLVLNSAPEEKKSDLDRLRPRNLAEFVALPQPGYLPEPIMPNGSSPEELPAPEGDVYCGSSRCFLRSFWPVVPDYYPDVRNEFNTEELAKTAGVPLLPVD